MARGFGTLGLFSDLRRLLPGGTVSALGRFAVCGEGAFAYRDGSGPAPTLAPGTAREKEKGECMPQTAMTLPEVADIAGVEYRTLHTWLRRGLLRPSVRSSSGTGKPNLFTPSDAVAARILADLRRGGLGIEQLERTAKALSEHSSALAEPAIIVINGRVDVVHDPAQAAAALAREGLTLAYNTAHALQHVGKAAAEAA